MFEAATPRRAEMKNESVVVIGDLSSHQCYFSLDDLLHVTPNSFRVVVTFTINNDPMRHSLHGKRKRLESADLERGIIEYVEILRAKCIFLARQDRKSSGYFPNIRREHLYG